MWTGTELWNMLPFGDGRGEPRRRFEKVAPLKVRGNCPRKRQ